MKTDMTHRLIHLVTVLVVVAGLGMLSGVGWVVWSFVSTTQAVQARQAALPPLPSVQPVVATLEPTQVVLPTAPPLPTATATTIPVPTATALPLPPLDALRIPAINLARPVLPAPFVDGAWAVPQYAVGHHVDSGQPGDGTNIVLNGHVGGSDPVFADVALLQPGDVLWLYRGTAATAYVVSDTLRIQVVGIPPDQVGAEAERLLSPTDTELVTLITCWPPSGPNAFDQRLIVRAVRQEGQP
ncbi:sortase family protein (plasmid) [Herpetosiphon aurantiacus DSM 785]|uniref:Sortase family protein n=1 Tax=Herpetosiphon aurantiacus (strain ATCC 23779 / DSM 785 / 114-95) TaxID=316274 RepID=A9B8M6_HERA2|nr:sortase family protein [Herpetosiphon aurantiacus DSM 785]